MAKFPILLLLSLLVHACVAQLGQEQQFLWQNLQTQQQHTLRARTDCRIQRLEAQEPTIRLESEGGVTEFWDRNNEQFECAGVAAVRNQIQPRGLLLPHYNNAPQLVYIVRGRGLLGTVFSGCAETFETEIQQQQQQPRRGFQESEQSRSFGDRHQKVRQFNQGDILALPAATTLWFYNNGEEPLVTVSLLDTGNEINQLDQTFRNFFLAGKPQGPEKQQGQEKNNIFNGLDDQLLAEAFGVDIELVRQLKGQNDQRGNIVLAQKFNVVVPSLQQEQEMEQQYGNGLEETVCSVKLRENIDNPIRADVFNPRGGRISTINSLKLPILRWLSLSAERGVLYRNALLAPHWTVNAHSIIYVTRGSGRFQVVGHTGQPVFDGEVREGQLIIVPQNFVVVKKASEQQGLEWISFKTNDNAVSSQLAGRLSAIRGMPEDVLMNSYDISREDAKQLKYMRQESKVLSGMSPRSLERPRPLEYAFDVIKSVM